jgi:phage repressor protein C with HTH and peptisase S24 domain
MENVSDRITAFIEDKKLTTTSLSKELGISWTAVNNYTKGRIPDGRTLINFKQKFGVNINWLLTGEGEMYIQPKRLNVLREPELNYQKLPKVITTDSQGQENILMVPHYAQAGYLDGFGDPEYLETLPSYRLPKINNGTFRMFEVKGHSMNPTLHDGSIAVGEWCESLNSIVDDAIYIVVTKDDGIVIKRVLNRVSKYNNLYLKSDNRSEYPAYTITPDQVVEIWKLKTAFLFNFSNPANMYDRLTDLEAEMMHLKQVINK